MKNSIIYLLLLGALLLISCDKEDPNAAAGQIFAQKDGKDWNSYKVYFNLLDIENSQNSVGFHISASFVDKQSVVREVLIIQTFLPTYFRQEIMEQWNVSNFENRKILNPYLITVLDEGDVSGSKYGIDPSVNTNFIQITKIDSANNMIYGIFDLSMVIVRRSSSQPNIPESIELKNGRFNARLPMGWNKAVF